LLWLNTLQSDFTVVITLFLDGEYGKSKLTAFTPLAHYFTEDCLENWVELRLLSRLIQMGKN